MPIDFSDTSKLIDEINEMIMKEEIENKEKTEICVICGKDTGVPVNQNIDLRKTYVEGAGQLCSTCYNKLYNPKLT
jgi:hypothetical protein